MARRYRDWWRPWNWSMRRWAVALIVMIIASPFLTRWFCLWQVPDVALPFDVEEFLSAEEVDDKDDAFVHYAAAARILTASGSRWRSQSKSSDLATVIEQVLEKPDSAWDPRLEQWLNDNSAALVEYRQGGAKPRAKGPSLRTADANTMLTTHNEVRHLARLSQLEAIRCESAGDFEAAWQWHRANMQCARHSETPKIDICRLVASAVRSGAFRGIARWAELPLLTSAQLRAARLEVQSEAELRTSRFECSKGEYLLCRNTLRLADFPNHMLPWWNRGVGGHPGWRPLKQMGLWLFGQPEVILRLQRQLLVNNQKLIDLPLYQRPPTTDSNAVVFRTEANAVRAWGQMAPVNLAAQLKHTVLRLDEFTATISSKHVDQAIQKENARLAALLVVLACQEFRRDHGEFPRTLEALVPEYLQTIPFDPMVATAVSMNYRREPGGEAVVWSIGQDGKDGDGDVNELKYVSTDEGYRLRIPSDEPAKPDL